MDGLISIIMPAYNRENLIGDAIGSVLSQSYGNFEIIVVDDGSADNTVKICNELAEKDSRIKVFVADHGGVSAARNMALEKATGEYLFFLDSDDMIHPKTLESLVIAMEQTGAGIGGTACVNVSENNWHKVYEKIKQPCDLSAYDFKPYEIAVEEFFSATTPINLIGGVIIRRDEVCETRFKTELSIGEDFCFIYENLIKGLSAVFLQSKFYYARIGNQNSSFVYDFEAFNSRFMRRVFVWRKEEELGRIKNVKAQKNDAMACYLRCLKCNKAKSSEVKKMRRVMKEYKKELFKAFGIKQKVNYYLSVCTPSIYLKLKNRSGN